MPSEVHSGGSLRSLTAVSADGPAAPAGPAARARGERNPATKRRGSPSHLRSSTRGNAQLMTGSDADPPANDRPDAAGPQGNEITAHQSYSAPASGARRHLVMEFTVQAGTGPAAGTLAREQATAIRQALAQTASKQPAKPEPDDRGHPPLSPSPPGHREATADNQPTQRRMRRHDHRRSAWSPAGGTTEVFTFEWGLVSHLPLSFRVGRWFFWRGWLGGRRRPFLLSGGVLWRGRACSRCLVPGSCW